MSEVKLDHIIVLPGGGYRNHATHEAEPIAEWIRSLGIGSSVFRYPVLTAHPGPLQAIRRAISDTRARGSERVGLIGFSAGGHAAALAALAPGATAHDRVDLAILGYPVISMRTPTHRGSRHNLIGPGAEDRLRAETSPELLVGKDAPPFFLFHTAEDPAVPAQHSLMFVSALAAAGVPFELHVYERGRHGVGLGTGLGTVEDWTIACRRWLSQLGWARTS